MNMLLSANEQTYVRGLKRREREEVTLALAPIAKSQHVVEPLRIRVLRSHLPPELKQRIFGELTTCLSDKYVQWVQKVLSVPLHVQKVPKRAESAALALSEALRKMQGAVAGHDAAKQEVLQLVLHQHRGRVAKQSYALGFEGPPGCGKTLFVKEGLVPALQRPVVNIPLGGASDVSFLLGHSYTYEGSKEGALAAGLIESKCMNPVVYFDEVDKISETERGREICNLLIHLIDPTANGALRDRYFHGLDLDFSNCTFVFSFNDASKVNPILLDRIKRVEIRAPTADERKKILTDYVMPRLQKRLRTKLSLHDGVVDLLCAIHSSGGMRECERHAEHVVGSALVQQALHPTQFEGDVVPLAFAAPLLPTAAPPSSSPPAGMYT
jgi:ATP-dependent Lon protease